MKVPFFISSRLLVLLPVFAAASGGAESSLSFTGLADLPGGDVFSTVAGVSHNGLWAVGVSSSVRGEEAARWNLVTGAATALGDMPVAPFVSAATGISNDGMKIAGRGTPGVGQTRAAYWSSPTTIVNLKALADTGFIYSEARGISADGTKLVGSSSMNSPGLRAFLWVAGKPPPQNPLLNLGTAPLTPVGTGDLLILSSQSNAISADGSLVVGSSFYSLSQSVPDPDPFDNYVPPPIPISSGSVAFVHANGAMSALPLLVPSLQFAAANAISANNQVIVGHAQSHDGVEGVLWRNQGIVSVGDLPGGDVNCRLQAVNEDGSRAAGLGTDAAGTTAVIWSPSFGLRKLKDTLQENGIDLTGWTLKEVTGMSDDGETLVGNGTNPNRQTQAWVITHAAKLFNPPEPPRVDVTVGTAITFPVQPGESYQPRYSDDGGVTWENLGPLVDFSALGTTGVTHAVPDLSAHQGRQYKVQVAGAGTAPVPLLQQGVILRFRAQRGLQYQVETSSGLTNWTGPIATVNTAKDLGSTWRSLFLPKAPWDHRKFFRLKMSAP